MYEFENLTILVREDESQHAYNDIMASIRDIDVEDIIRESPAFNEEMEN